MKDQHKEATDFGVWLDWHKLRLGGAVIGGIIGVITQSNADVIVFLFAGAIGSVFGWIGAGIIEK